MDYCGGGAFYFNWRKTGLEILNFKKMKYKEEDMKTPSMENMSIVDIRETAGSGQGPGCTWLAD